MHLLATASASIDDLVEAVDLRQSPGDIVILSFADSDLSGLAAAWAAQRDVLPTVRLANLRDLRHPLSVDLWLDTVGRHAKVVVVRLLGGLDWWRYGVERLSSLAREKSIALAVLPGEDRDDPRLAEASTLPAHELNTLLRFFREGGGENLGALLRRLAQHSGARLEAPEPRPVPRTAGYISGEGAVDLDRLVSFCQRGRPCVPIILYRAMLLAADTAPIDALCRALAERGLEPAPLVVPSLKDRAAAEFVRAALARLKPAVIVTATAFAAAATAGEPTPFDAIDVPVLQAVIATTRRSAWWQSPRGLGPADLAMHVVLPELDGRVLQGVVAFKGPLPAQDDLCFSAFGSLPEADRVAVLADRIAALIKLQATPRSERRVAVLLPDYPGAPGRAGYAVGLDVPASVVGLLSDMEQANYHVAGAPKSSRALLDALAEPSNDAALPLDHYRDLVAALPGEAIAPCSTRPSSSGSTTCIARSAGPRPRGLCDQTERLVVAITACSTGTSVSSNGVGSPALVVAAKAVAVTTTAGLSRVSAARTNSAAARSFKLETTSGAGPNPRSASARHSASIGAVSAASNIAR